MSHYPDTPGELDDLAARYAVVHRVRLLWGRRLTFGQFIHHPDLYEERATRLLRDWRDNPRFCARTSSDIYIN